MSSVPKRNDFQQRLINMERRLKTMETASRLRSTSTGSGGLTIRDEGALRVEHENGVDAVFLGFRPFGNQFYGVILQDPDGEDILVVGSDNEGDTWLQSATDSFFFGTNSDSRILGDVSGLPGVAVISGGPIYNWATEHIDLASDTSDVRISHETTGAAANAVLDATTGRIRRQVSSMRYKESVRGEVVDTSAALQLMPRRFKMRSDVRKLGRDDAPEYVGFIAEDAANLGLEDWIVRDEDGPEAFSYAMWVVALQAIVQEQQSAIDSLSTQVSDLMARVSALESVR